MMNNIYSALKKINQIGKKMSNSGKYILVSGMMISIDTNDRYDTQPNGATITFIDPSILKKMDAIPMIGLEIDGTELYDQSKNEFNKITCDLNGNVKVHFSADEFEDNSFIHDFVNSMKNHGYDEELVKDAIIRNFDNIETDIDIYDKYIKFKNSYSKENRVVDKCVVMNKIDYDNKILSKFNKIIDDIYSGKCVYHEDYSKESSEKILNSKKPISIYNKEIGHTIRIMKSLFKCTSSTSSISIKIIKCDNWYYLILGVNNPGFDTISIYKSI